MECIAKIDFSRKLVLVISGWIYDVFLGLGDSFFDFFSLESRLENRRNFVMKPDPKRVIWWGRSVGFWASKDRKSIG